MTDQVESSGTIFRTQGSMAPKGAPKLPGRDVRDISKACSSICRRRGPYPCPMRLLPRDRFRFCGGICVEHFLLRWPILCTFTSEADRALKPSIETDHGAIREGYFVRPQSGNRALNQLMANIVYEMILFRLSSTGCMHMLTYY